MWGGVGVEDKVANVGTNILPNSLRACVCVMLVGVVGVHGTLSKD
jgi:hypothetical protein